MEKLLFRTEFGDGTYSQINYTDLFNVLCEHILYTLMCSAFLAWPCLNSFSICQGPVEAIVKCDIFIQKNSHVMLNTIILPSLVIS